MYRLLFVVTACLAANHPELRGEEPDQSDIDNGQCIPIKCELGIPPEKCTRLCALRQYVPTCQTAGDFCLCQRLVGNSIELISPDEVEDQPPPPTEETHTYTFFAVFVPLKDFFFKESSSEEATSGQTSAEPIVGYETVNVHDGKLFWGFRYILTGLFLLMVCLVIYELIMCRLQSYGKSEPAEPNVKVLSV